MTVIEALRNRRAIRDFRPEAVEPGVIRELIEAATQAPSYMNLQPWSFAVCDGIEAMEGLERAALRWMEAAAPALRDDPECQDRSAPEGRLFYNAPALVVICATLPGEPARLACAMAAADLMLAAQAAGLGSCWISGALPWLRSDDGRAALGIAPEDQVVAPLLLGAPAAQPAAPGRFVPRIAWTARPSGTTPMGLRRVPGAESLSDRY